MSIMKPETLNENDSQVRKRHLVHWYKTMHDWMVLAHENGELALPGPHKVQKGPDELECSNSYRHHLRCYLRALEFAKKYGDNKKYARNITHEEIIESFYGSMTFSVWWNCSLETMKARIETLRNKALCCCERHASNHHIF